MAQHPTFGLKGIKMTNNDKALAALTEQVEGLDEAMERVEDSCQQYGARAYYMPEDIGAILEAARLYAQGRTQSEVPEGNTVDELVMLIGRLVHKSRNVPEMADLRAKTLDYLQRKNLTPSPLRDEAAPTVTAPIEKVDGLAEAVDKMWKWLNDLTADCPYEEIETLHKAARLQLQRQGD